MQTETKTRTIDEFIQDNNIGIRCDIVDANPNMNDPKWDATHYRVSINRGGFVDGPYREMETYFSQGKGHVNVPDLRDVLDCLASEAAGYENARTFEDWAEEYGYDTDSRKAERTYHAIQGQSVLLLRFLGRTLFDELLAIERL